MTDQPLTEVKATVFKQFRLKWEEVGKSAVISALTTALAVVAPSIYAMEWPTNEMWMQALNVGKYTFIGAIIRYYINPTTTVIKGQHDPTAIVSPPNVVVKDVNKP